MTTISQSGPCGKSSHCLSASQDENGAVPHKECLCDNKHTITLVSQMLCLGIRHLLLLSSVLFHPFPHSNSLTHTAPQSVCHAFCWFHFSQRKSRNLFPFKNKDAYLIFFKGICPPCPCLVMLAVRSGRATWERSESFCSLTTSTHQRLVSPMQTFGY